jgi:transcriptional regulator GlxA family with amidase domain
MSRSLVLELALDCEAFRLVQPPALRQLLCAAAATVAGDGRVDTLAQHLRISTRTLSRLTHDICLASPRAVLLAVRLLWACTLDESARYDVGSVARASGFAGPYAMLAATQHYLTPDVVAMRPASLPAFGDALRRIVRALGGHLAS